MKRLIIAGVVGVAVTLGLCLVDAMEWDSLTKACRTKGGTTVFHDRGCYKITKELIP